MPRELTVAALQTSYGEDLDANIARTAEADPRGRRPAAPR